MNDPSRTTLVEITDDDFAALLRGDALVRDTLVQPPGGVDRPDVLAHVRRLAADSRAHGYPGGHWMMVAGGEVVGLCGFKAPPTHDGEVEIGYSVAASRRRRGHAGAAIATILEIARGDPALRAIIALTSFMNEASQRALERTGFERCGTRADESGEELVVWRRQL
jgi:RimJ/RimL family protein N-acetyltransferase